MKLLSLTACHSTAAWAAPGVAGSGVGCSVISGVTGSVVVMAGAVAVGERNESRR